MELKWLEDLIALGETDTLSEAAQQRNITQPAFSRRIKAIEDWLGVAVVDRSRRPVRVTPAIRNQLDDIQTLARELRRLRSELRSWEGAQRRIIIGAQHTLSIVFLPQFIAHLQSLLPATTIRLRSGNRDEIFALLMTRQAMLLIGYETATYPLDADEALLEKIVLEQDRLIPVASAEMIASRPVSEARELNIIAYPQKVFFGALLHNDILPALNERFAVTTVCESALVPAIAELALAGVGIAWLPSALVAPHLRSGRLRDLETYIGSADLQIVAARLKTPSSSTLDLVWKQLEMFSGYLPEVTGRIPQC